MRVSRPRRDFRSPRCAMRLSISLLPLCGEKGSRWRCDPLSPSQFSFSPVQRGEGKQAASAMRGRNPSPGVSFAHEHTHCIRLRARLLAAAACRLQARSPARQFGQRRLRRPDMGAARGSRVDGAGPGAGAGRTRAAELDQPPPRPAQRAAVRFLHRAGRLAEPAAHDCGGQFADRQRGRYAAPAGHARRRAVGAVAAAPAGRCRRLRPGAGALARRRHGLDPDHPRQRRRAAG